MKLRFLLMLYCVLKACSINAQNNFDTLCDSMFLQLKTTQIYKSCLWNYGFADSSIFKFNGQVSNENSDFENLSSAYQFWENSIMESELKPMPFNNVMRRLRDGFNNGIIHVPCVLAIGDRIKKQAFESKKIEFDTTIGQLIVNDVHDLYESESVFISAPFIQRVFTKFVSLNFHDSLFFTNSDLTIREIQIRLNNELFHSINLSELINLELQPGNNTLVIKYLLNDGKSYISNTSLVFDDYESTFGNSKILGFGIGDPLGNIYAEPYRTTEYELPLGANIQVIPGIENGVEHSCLKKPILFVEGIDFGYKDHETGCYGGKCGAMGLRDLLRGKIFHPYESKSQNAYEEWEPIKLAPKLIDELKRAGYDLIYLDFHNGAEYMENNAMLLVDLIKRVNYMKCSKEELVVIGASMGGQVARFALSYMEKANIPHCVRTFVAYDSPNQGAVIPLGLQHFLKYYSGKLPTVKEQFKRKLDRAASRQLLMNQCLSMDGAGENSDRVSFKYALDALGNYPKACRNIALLNGSIDKTDLGHQAGDVLLKMNPFLGTINFDFAEINCTIWSTYYDVDFKHVVMEGKFPGKGKFLVEVPVETPQYDFVPGSKRYDLKSYRSILGVFNIINKMDFTCFIPSYSALGLNTNEPYFDIAGRLNKDIPNPLYTPFEAFYGVRGEGQEHMMITDDNIDWLLNQIELNRNDVPEELISTYNMGRITNNRLNTLRVKGTLKINGKGRNGFGNGKYDQVNKPGSIFTAITDNCQSVVTIEDKGVLELGTDAANDGNIAVLIVKKGSVLELNGGSRLLVNNHSKLIIEEGAKLIYNKDATIQLDGNDAQIQIDGELHIGSSAVFSVIQGNSKVPGYLKFRHVGGGYGACKITYDSDAEFKLTGNSKSTDLLMQVEGVLYFEGNARLKLFKLENGKVAYGNNSAIQFLGDVSVKSCSFEVLSWAKKNTSNALVLKGFKKATFSQCDFQSFNFGIETKPSTGAELLIENTTLKSCVNALVLSHTKTELNNVVLRSNVEHGLYCFNQFEQLQMANVQLLFNSKGMFVNSNLSLPPKCFIDNCSFSSNDIGIQSINSHLTLLCSRFVSNTIGVDVRDGVLNLSPNFVMYGSSYSLSGGNNTFLQQSGSGVKCDHTVLYLEDGKNNFMYQGSNNNGKLISGFVAYLPATHQSQSPYNLKADNNYWYPVSTVSLNQLGLPYYDLKSDLPGSPNAKIQLNGNKMKTINTVCYNAGGCLTCPITQFEEDSVEYGQIELLVYPQPAEEMLQLKFNRTISNAMIKIRDINGQVKYESIVDEIKLLSLSVKEWNSGVYILEIELNGSIIKRQLLIK